MRARGKVSHLSQKCDDGSNILVAAMIGETEVKKARCRNRAAHNLAGGPSLLNRPSYDKLPHEDSGQHLTGSAG